jgi:hypothetical protein
MLQRSPNQWKPAGRRDSSEQFPTLLAVNGIIVLVLLILALSVPSASRWISAAAEAEFGNPGMPSVSPTQIAQPAESVRIVKSN